MGSVGEEELVQMVRDYIESESTTPSTPVTSSKRLPHNPQYPFQDILLEARDFETQILDRILMYVRNMGEPNSLKKWVVMRLQMDGYEASLCKTSWFSTFGHKDGYEYIDVMLVGKNSSKATRVIVDMDFRSQFLLARPTQSYKELVNALPAVFVGTEERLDKIINVLCSAAKRSLKEKGLHIPPWRKAKYMQSKWLSKNCKKVSVWPNDAELGVDKSEEKDGTTATTTSCSSISIF